MLLLLQKMRRISSFNGQVSHGGSWQQLQLLLLSLLLLSLLVLMLVPALLNFWR